MALSASDRQNLKARLITTSAVSMVNFLTVRGFKPSGPRNLDDQAERMLDLVASDELTKDDVATFILEFLECNAKRVFVFDCKPDPGQKAHLASLHKQRPIPGYRDINLGAANPQLAYTNVSAKSARAVWVEPHRRVWLDRANESVKTSTVPRIVVAEYHFATKRLHVSLDAPFTHTHGTTADSYFQHYFTQARSTLGVGATEVNLRPWLMTLYGDRNKVEVNGQNGDAQDGVKHRTSYYKGDMRDMASVKSVSPYISVRKALEIKWKPGVQPPLAGLHPLVRGLRTKVDGDAGMISFEQHTLRFEVDYVLAHVP